MAVISVDTMENVQITWKVFRWPGKCKKKSPNDLNTFPASLSSTRTQSPRAQSPQTKRLAFLLLPAHPSERWWSMEEILPRYISKYRSITHILRMCNCYWIGLLKIIDQSIITDTSDGGRRGTLFTLLIRWIVLNMIPVNVCSSSCMLRQIGFSGK